MSEQNKQADPHAEDLKRALVAIRDLRRQLQQLEARSGESIAIIGMACRLPGGADTPERYWDLLRNGIDATSDVPANRWDIESYYDPDPDAPGCMYTNRGGFLTAPVDQFDAAHFSISPREAAAMDPVHRMLLELSWEALERAGIAPQSISGSDTGVFLGLSGSDYNVLQLKGASSTALNMYSGTGSAPSIASGRISHFFGLHGPNLAVDTLCSSSLVATVLAVESLRAGKCSMALAGGAQLMLAPESTVYMCKLHALSPGGRSRTFDAAADGYGRGEGGGIVVLKRLSEAVRDGDPIVAVIRGVAYNHDGHSSGLTVPNPAAQRLVIQAALKNAGLSPNDIDYVEAHGTGTPLGDPIEIRAVADVLCRSRSVDAPLLIGSAKANLGHLEAAAGVSGLMKLALAVSKAEIPPHINCESPTPHVDWDTLSVRVVRERTSWNPEGARVGGVSAFGLSGTNAHVIVESAPADSRSRPAPRPAELIVLSGRTRDAVRQLAERYREYISSSDAAALPDIALTSLLARSPLPFRATVVAPDPATMAEKLNAITNAPDDAIANVKAPPSGRIAFLFTGQGAQFPGMGRELYTHSAVARSVLDRCDEILRPHMDRSLLELLTIEEDADVLKQTQYAQPALFAFEYALAALWQSWGVKPAAVAGHSLGEYVAATVAGVLSLEDALPLVALRGRLMQALPDGGRMCAVFAPEAHVAQHVAAVAGVSIAAINGPSNSVISGSAAEVGEVLARLQQDGVEGKDLHVSHAFHSALMDPMLDDFEQAIRRVALNAPRIPVISNLTGVELTARDAVDPVRWRRHIREPVRFAQSLRTLFELGASTFLEIGPHPALSAMGTATINEPGLRWLPSMRRGRSAWQQLLETVGDLWRAGYEIDVAGFAREHGGRRIAAPTYTFQRSRFWFTDDLPIAAATASARPGGVPHGPHPLLGAALHSPAFDGWVFETIVEPDSRTYLDDHRVGATAIVPAAAFVEMMLAAARFGPGWATVGLDHLTIAHPLVLAADRATYCQVIIATPVGGIAQSRLVASTDDRMNWMTIATGVLLADDAHSPPKPASIDALRSANPATVDIATLYAGIERRGITYGPAFRTLIAAWTGDDGAFGRAQLNSHTESNGYVLHPCLLDAAFHLLASISGSGDDPSATFLPVGIDRVQVFEPAGNACWIQAWVRTSDVPSPDHLTCDVLLLGDDGRAVAKLDGFRTQRVRGGIRDHVEDSLYGLEWEDITTATPSDAQPGTWLLIDGGSAEGSLLERALARRGAGCVRVQPDAVKKLSLDAHQPAGVIHLQSLAAQSVDDADDATRAIVGCADVVIDLIRARIVGDGTVLRVVTCGSAGSEAPEGDTWAAGAALWGALPALRAEHPELQARIVDFKPESPADYDLLTAWLLGDSDEDRVALRGGRAFAPRLINGLPHPALPGTADAMAAGNGPRQGVASGVRGDGAYIVTGASGGIGRSLAEWLVQRGAGALVLSARSTPDESTEQWLASLRDRGTRVQWVSGDTTVRSDVDAMITLAQSSGLPLRGVFHAAGIVDDGLLLSYDADRFARVIAPKVNGALNLHAAVLSHDLDHFVLFSSTAALMGGTGQVAYAAGNAFLGALARYRRSRGHAGLCIDWGAWAGSGMAGRLSNRESQMLEQRGLKFLEHNDALERLGRLLEQNPAHAIVVNVDWERLRAASASRPLSLLKRLLDTPRRDASTTAPIKAGPVLNPATLAELPADEREARIVAYVLEAITAVLRLRRGELDVDTPLPSLGMDSLTNMELRNRVESDLGVLLPTAVLLQAETPADIVNTIAGRTPVVSTAAAAGVEWLEGEI